MNFAKINENKEIIYDIDLQTVRSFINKDTTNLIYLTNKIINNNDINNNNI